MSERGEYLTYLDRSGPITVEIDSHAVHPDKSIIEDVLLGKKPVFRFNLESLDLHRYLDSARGHVFDCREECKAVVDGMERNEY